MEQAHRKILPPSEVLCKFFLQGYCARGSACWFKHELESTNVFPMSYTTMPTGPEGDNENRMKVFMTTSAKEKSKCCGIENADRSTQDDSLDASMYTALTVSQICSICFETPITFGLLEKCTHVFCLDCIRKWRSSSSIPGNHAEKLSKTSKTCPLCRTTSSFIIPSSIFPSPKVNGHDEDFVNPLKQKIIEKYLGKLKTIPCRYFEESLKNVDSDCSPLPRPRCLFGNSCHYAHTDPRTQGSYVFTDAELRKMRQRPVHTNRLRLFSRSEIIRSIFTEDLALSPDTSANLANYELYVNDNLEHFLRYMLDDSEYEDEDHNSVISLQDITDMGPDVSLNNNYDDMLNA